MVTIRRKYMAVLDCIGVAIISLQYFPLYLYFPILLLSPTFFRCIPHCIISNTTAQYCSLDSLVFMFRNTTLCSLIKDRDNKKHVGFRVVFVQNDIATKSVLWLPFEQFLYSTFLGHKQRARCKKITILFLRLLFLGPKTTQRQNVTLHSPHQKGVLKKTKSQNRQNFE